MTKLNSIDIAYFNARDVKELMEIADKATAELLLFAEAESLADQEIHGFRARFEAIRDRRAKEDAGEQLP